jgi:hypothetical protein
MPLCLRVKVEHTTPCLAAISVYKKLSPGSSNFSSSTAPQLGSYWCIYDMLKLWPFLVFWFSLHVTPIRALPRSAQYADGHGTPLNTKTHLNCTTLKHNNFTNMAPIDNAIGAFEFHKPGEQLTLQTCVDKYGVEHPTLGQRIRDQICPIEAKAALQQKFNPQQ